MDTVTISAAGAERAGAARGPAAMAGEVRGPAAMVCGERGAAERVAEFRSWVASVDVSSLSDAQRVELVAELERVKGAASAGQARATDALRVSVEERAVEGAARSVGSQVALARRESPSLGDRFVGLARAIVTEMPVTMAALESGVVGERHAIAMVAETACLSREHRAVVDQRVGVLLGRLGVKAAAGAARRVAAELDAAAAVLRMEQAVRSRRVSVRPAPDGMAYLSVLGPLKDVVGAHAALLARARAVVGGHCPDEPADGAGVGAVAADTALRLLSGRAVGEVQPVEVHLVMTDRTLLGHGDGGRSVWEPARVPGHGSVPAPVARAWLRADAEGATGAASVWLRRLFTSPGGRDLVAMDSRRRVFSGLLRRMVVLRDDVCATPWCEAPIVHADHAEPVRSGGPTELGNGSGTCARCNQVKETEGWRVSVLHTGLDPGGGRPRQIEVTTPTGHTYRAIAPPVTGWGASHPPGDPVRTRRVPPGADPVVVGCERSESALEAALARLVDSAA